jgi:poly(A) polymerase
VDDLERRIGELAAEDRRRAERPAIDGNRVMELLGIPPGPEVGEAMAFLLALKRCGAATERDEAERRLEEWWQRQAR